MYYEELEKYKERAIEHNVCDEYLFTKGTVVKNIINGRLYLVISRKEKGLSIPMKMQCA